MNIIIKRVGAEPEVVSYENFGLEDMQELVGGLIEAIYVGGEIDLWCNDEGKVYDMPINLALGDTDNRQILDTIHGDVFFAARDDTGNTIGLTEAQQIWIMNQFKSPDYGMCLDEGGFCLFPIWHYNPTAAL